MRRALVLAVVAAAVLLAGGGLALARQGSTATRAGGKQTTVTRPLHVLRLRRVRRLVRRRLTAAAASYLGISRAELRRELRSGRTLAQIADAHGKAADGLVQQLVMLVRGRLDRAVSRGRLTGAQEQALLARVERRLDRVVNRTFG